jgi:hypothetical protein
MKKGEQDVVKELPLMIDHLIAVRNKFKNKYKNFIDSNRYYEIEQETLKKKFKWIWTLGILTTVLLNL